MFKFMDIIYKNWKKYQVIIILLILLFIFMIYYKIHSRMRENFDGNEIPLDVKEISSKTLSEVFFIKNFPNKTDEMRLIWEGKMDDNRYISFWQRQPLDEYFPVGQVSLITNSPSKSTDLSITNQSGLQFLVKGGVSPVDFEKIWDSEKVANLKPLSIWKVIPPNNYYALGDIVVDGFDKPNPDLINIKCLPIDILETQGEINNAVWKNPQPKKNEPEISPENSLSVWNIGDYGFFIANNSYVKPDAKVKKVWSIKDKIIENQEYDPIEINKKLKITLKV